MEHDVAQHLTGVLVIAAQLRAAVVVVPGVDGVDVLAACLFAQLLGQAFGNAVDAAHGGHNPYLIAHAHVAVLAAITLKGAVLFFDIKSLVYRVIRIFKRSL